MDTNLKSISADKNIIKALVLIMLLSFCVTPLLGQDNKVNDLKKLYRNSCAKCHGPDGSAVGDDGKKLKGEDFTDQKWLKDTKDDKMIKVILGGKFFGLAMPAFKEILTGEDAQLMVTEIIRKSEKGKIIKPDNE